MIALFLKLAIKDQQEFNLQRKPLANRREKKCTSRKGLGFGEKGLNSWAGLPRVSQGGELVLGGVRGKDRRGLEGQD